MNWNATLKVKDLLTNEDVGPTQACRLAEGVVDRLRRATCFTPRVRDALFSAFEGVEDQDGFNEALGLLYDIGDEQRVWIY